MRMGGMQIVKGTFALTALALCAVSACGGGSDAPAGGGTVSVTFDTGGPGTCPNTLIPTNASFCSGVTTNTDCSDAQQRPLEGCGVLIGKPGEVNELKRTTDTYEYAAPGPVNLSCFDAGNYPTKGTVETVTMDGLVKIFAAGCDAVGVKVEVYTVIRDGSANDGKLGDLVGQPVTTDETFPTEDDPIKGDCAEGRTLRQYTYPGVPTETELVIKTSDATNSGWTELYDYNIYISNNDPDLIDGVWTHDVRALAEDDFATIPTAAIGRPISNGYGVVAGEVHDCDNIRVSYALVDVDSPRVAMVYLDDNEADPLPDTTRNAIGTAKLALFSALDVPPGPVTMSAVGVVDNKLVTLGYAKGYVYPNAVTTITLRGLRPHHLP
jgi:hypothetical protein